MQNDDAKYQHPAYIAELGVWRRNRDCVAGEEAIKAGQETYLPKISSEQDSDEYTAYLSRAMFYNATGRTVQGLLGAMFRKPTVLNLPAAMKVFLDDADGTGTPLPVLIQRLAQEILIEGRFGILVDMPETTSARPEVRLCAYTAEHIWDWRIEKKKLVHLVLHECIDQPDKDGMGHVISEQLLVLKLDNGIYTAQRFEKRPQKGADGMTTSYKFEPITELKVIEVRGKRLDTIPFFCFAPTDLTLDIEKSPVNDLVTVNLSHYRTTADYEHGAHHTALPTPVVIGLDPDSKQSLPLGPTRAWKVPMGGDAKMLEFTGKGLDTLKDMLTRKENMMVLLGARLLEDQKKGVEAAETHRIRHSGENSVLASIADTASRGISKALEIAAKWMSASGKVEVVVNKDFFDEPMDPQRMEALLKSWMSGGISKETYLWNMKRGEVLPDDITVEDELARIEQNVSTFSMPVDVNQPEPADEEEGGKKQAAE